MYIHTPMSFTIPLTSPVDPGASFSKGFNCAGGGGTLAYNVSSVVGIAADLGGCKYFGQQIPAFAAKISGSDFTYMFGPRFTYRSQSAFRPFFEVNFGGNRLKFSCKSGTRCNGTSYSKNAFALTAGGGFDIKLNKKFAIRLIQAEYLYTRFGNNCQLQLCSNNNNQNSFRLKSGIVIGWGGGPDLSRLRVARCNRAKYLWASRSSRPSPPATSTRSIPSRMVGVATEVRLLGGTQPRRSIRRTWPLAVTRSALV